MTRPRYIFLEPAAFWASEAVLELDGEARAAYALCLMRQGVTGTLPSDPTRLARVLGYPEIVDIWPRLVKLDHETGETVHLFPPVEGSPAACANPRMSESWSDAQEHMKRRSEAGKAGGKASAAARAVLPGKRQKSKPSAKRTTVQRSSERPLNDAVKQSSREVSKEVRSSDAAALQAASSIAAACATPVESSGEGGGAVPSQPPGGAAGTAPTTKADSQTGQEATRKAKAAQGDPEVARKPKSQKTPSTALERRPAKPRPGAMSTDDWSSYQRNKPPPCPQCQHDGSVVMPKSCPDSGAVVCADHGQPLAAIGWWYCGKCTAKFGRTDLQAPCVACEAAAGVERSNIPRKGSK